MLTARFFKPVHREILDQAAKRMGLRWREITHLADIT